MAGPLSGLRVVDCSAGTAGPQASGLLADYGADVIWIERPGGDLSRRLEPAAASVFNRGKRSIMLDLESPADRAHAIELAKRADVFVESWRPGEAARFGLGYESLHAANPHLVYCSISGFGADDPRRDLPAYEPIIHALLGSMAFQVGHREGPIFLGLPFASTGAAQLAVIGVLAALYRRMDDGFGRHVETSLLDGALAFHSMLWGESDASVAAKAQNLAAGMRGPTTQRLITRAFICKDEEYIGVHTAAVGAFGRLMEVLGLAEQIPPSPDGIDVGRPLTPDQAQLLESKIHGIFASETRDYWVKRLMEADVCAIEHQKPTLVFDTPQARHNDMVAVVDDPVLGRIEQVRPGIRFNDAVPAVSPAPGAGAHTNEVLDTLAKPDAASPWRPAVHAAAADTRPLLDGVKILDLGAYYAGPYSSRLLADMGAEVIKLETVSGDSLRGIERPFFSAQAGKRSLAANLKHPAFAPAIKKLIQWADLVHHNMRPGAAERLGLGAAQVKPLNPGAIYLYAPGWGSRGPYMMRQSFAPLLSGYVGGSYELAGQFNEPLPSGSANEDPGNGLLGAIGMLMALLHRRRTGVALSCENPQLNAAMGLLAHIVRNAEGEPIGAGELDVLQTGKAALESLYETADGWLCLVAREQDEIETLERILNLKILSDPRYATIERRAENRERLTEALREAFAKRSAADWLDAFGGANVALVAPVGAESMHDLMNDPRQRANGRVAEVSHPTLGGVREIAHLIRVSDAAFPPHRLAPGLGEHSDQILLELGYAREAIDALRAEKNLR